MTTFPQPSSPKPPATLSFSTYASRFLSTPRSPSPETSTPLFYSTYDRPTASASASISSSHHAAHHQPQHHEDGPWMNDDDIDREIALLEGSVRLEPVRGGGGGGAREEKRRLEEHERLGRDAAAAEAGPSSSSAFSRPAPSLQQHQHHQEADIYLSPPSSPSLPPSSPSTNSPPLTHSTLPGKQLTSPSAPPPLTESLLPARTIDVAPPPPEDVPVRKYRDAGWIAAFGFSLLGVMGLGLTLWYLDPPTPPLPPTTTPPSHPPPTPFQTLLHATPLLVLLTLASLAAGAAHLLVLRKAVVPLLTAALGAVMLGLLGAGAWAFAGSFFWGGEMEGEAAEREGGEAAAWWESSGLRWFSLVPLLIAVWFVRTVYVRRARIKRSIAVVELSATVLLAHPPLVLLHLSLTCLSVLLALPFLTLLYRLLRLGYWDAAPSPAAGGGSAAHWHVYAWADWLVLAVFAVWCWTWAVLRGIGTVATAGTVGGWYFRRYDPAHPSPAAQVRTSLHRATHPSLGSICLSALILALANTLARLAASLRDARFLQHRAAAAPLALVRGAAAALAGALDQLSQFALVYVGITGEGFWESARRVRALVRRREVGGVMDQLLISTTLRLLSLTCALLSSTAGFLYAAHTLARPQHAPLVAALCALVPYWTVRMWGDVLANCADTLFVCWCFDIRAGASHCFKADEAFGESAADDGREEGERLPY